MRYPLFSISVLFLLSLYACSETADDPQEYSPIVLDLKSQELVNTTNDFGFDLLRVVVAEENEKNVIISPMSVSQALGMVWNGAGGVTRDEMTRMLGFSVDNEQELNSFNKTIREALLGCDNRVDINIANSVWYRNTYSVKQDFVDVNREYYDAPVEALDFTDPRSKDVINDWVNDKTKGCIPSIVDEISPDDIMFLINAIYFKGKWTYQFDKNNTVDEPFYFVDGSSNDVKMMVQENTLEYFGKAGYKGLILPYGNGHFSMVIILPDPDVELKNIVEELNVQELDDEIKNATETNVKVWLPKFSFEYKSELKPLLIKLGMVTAFSDMADLSGIGTSLNLEISSVKHNAFVEVNEEGTEAAAVTSVTVGYTSVGPDEGTPEFKVNRPFMFLIREKDTGTVMFSGQVYDPSN
ncbi:MAG: serpin family protein [Chlorobi bacterium]|nr:serpin family protein [Chlorobiota bacterium]